MKELFEEPPRWREHSDQNNIAERTIGQDLRAIRTPALLSEAQMARIAARTRPARARHSRPWLVLAAALVLGVATAAFATHLHLVPRWLKGASAPRPVDAPEHRAGRRKSGAISHPTAPEPGKREAPPAQPTVESPSTAQPTTASLSAPEATTAAPAPRRSFLPVRPAQPVGRIDRTDTDRTDSDGVHGSVPVAPLPAATQPQVAAYSEPLSPPPTVVAPPTTAAVPVHAPVGTTSQVAMRDPMRPPASKPVKEPPKPEDDAETSRILGDAIRLLRADGRPQSALALLDRHAIRLGQSPYRHEALLVKVEALLALKRDGELLRLLDGVLLADVAASRTLLTTRGRLRAAAHRCPEAVVDFDRVLAEAGGKDRQALLGRASCREAMGDREGAKADRERYRQESSLSPGAMPKPGPPANP